VNQFELLVSQPDAAIDADRDTYVDQGKGGTDCNDGDIQVNPGAAQVCGSSVDTNCNGKLYCADPSCANDLACLTLANGLAFETMLPTLPAGDCSSEVVVQSTASGRPAAVGADVSVLLTPTGPGATGVELFSDSSCGTRLTSGMLTLRFGTSRASFSFRARTAGLLTLSASAMDLGTTHLMTDITNRPVDHLAVTPASLTVRSSACSAAFQVTALDVQNQPTNTTGGLPLAISFLPAGTTSVSTFTDSSCAFPGTPTIAVDTSSTVFYVKGTTATLATPITVRVSTPSVNNGMPATAELNVTAGDPVRMAFTSPTTGVANTTCGVMPLELQLLDANGNVAVAPAGGLTVNLTYVAPPTTGTLELFSGMGCTGSAVTSITLAAGSSSALLSVRAMGAGLYTVTASSSLPTPTATTQVSVATMNPTALVFPSPSMTIQTGAGVCSPAVRVQTRESNSLSAAVSPVPADVQLTISPSPAGAVTLHRDPSCTMALGNPATLTMRGGTSEQVFYFRSDRAGSLTLSVSAAGGSGLSATTPEQGARVVPGPTTKLVLTPLALASVAGTCSPQVAIGSTDAFNNPTSPTGAVTLTATPVLAPPQGAAFSQVSDCATTGNSAQLVDGGAFFYASAQRAQNYSLTATAGSASSVAPVVFSVDAGAPAVLAVALQPTATLAAGLCAPVTIERRDAFGNPATGAPDALTVTPDNATVLSVHGDLTACAVGNPGATVAFAPGQTRATFAVRGRQVGSASLTVSSSAGATSVTTSSVMVNASATTRLRFSQPLPVTSNVGACVTVTVERLDTEGNLSTLPGTFNATVAATGAGASGLLLSVGTSCGTTPALSVPLAFGSSNVARFSYDPRTLGALTFDVTSGTITGASGTTTVAAGNLARVRFVSPVTTGAYDACQDFTIEALDSGNNRLAGATGVTLSSSALGTFFPGGCGNPAANMVTIPGGGVAVFGYLPLALGSATLTANGGSGVSGTAPLSISAGTENELLRSPAFAAQLTAGTPGACTTFTVTRVDTGAHPTGGPARTVTATLSGAAAIAPFEAQLFDGMNCVTGATSTTKDFTIGVGASAVQFSVRARKAGALTLSLTSPTAPALLLPSNTATTVVGGALARITLSPAPPASLITGICSPAITVTGDDNNGNAAPLGTQALSMTGATFSSLSDCTDTIPNLAAGSASTATFYLKNATASMPTLTVGTNPLTATQSWTIVNPTPTQLRWKPGAEPPASLARFTCSSAIRVQAVDGAGNPGPSAARVLSFGVVPTGLRFFTNASCSTPMPAGFGIAAGQSETVDFFLGGVAAATHSLTASDTTIVSPLSATAAAPVDVTGSGTATLSVTPMSTDLHFKSCVQLTLRRGVGATNVTFDSLPVDLSLSGGAASAVTFHALSNCSDTGVSTTTVTIPAGSATTLAYVRGHSAEPSDSGLNQSGATLATTTASAVDSSGVFTTGVSSALAVHPAVRRGTCAIADGQSLGTCTILPALPLDMRNRAFFTVQVLAPGTSNVPSNMAANCVLNATTSIDCRRGGTSGALEVTWQLVSMATGLDVGHFSGSFSGQTGNQNIDVTSAGLTAASEAFLLFNFAATGPMYGGDDQATAQLTSATNATLSLPAGETWPQSSYNLQVVKLAGTSVARNVVTTNMVGDTTLTASPSAPPANTGQILLFSQRINGTDEARQTRLRGEVTGPTTLTFARNGGGNAITVSWERASIPTSLATVQAFPTLDITGNTTLGVALLGSNPQPLHRIWSFVGGQGLNGQCGGQTSEAAPTFSTAKLDYVLNTNFFIRLTRGSNGGGNVSSFGTFAVTFVP